MPVLKLMGVTAVTVKIPSHTIDVYIELVHKDPFFLDFKG